jgi:hypothetical protein
MKKINLLFNNKSIYNKFWISKTKTSNKINNNLLINNNKNYNNLLINNSKSFKKFQFKIIYQLKNTIKSKLIMED